MGRLPFIVFLLVLPLSCYKLGNHFISKQFVKHLLLAHQHFFSFRSSHMTQRLSGGFRYCFELMDVVMESIPHEVCVKLKIVVGVRLGFRSLLVEPAEAS